MATSCFSGVLNFMQANGEEFLLSELATTGIHDFRFESSPTLLEASEFFQIRPQEQLAALLEIDFSFEFIRDALSDPPSISESEPAKSCELHAIEDDETIRNGSSSPDAVTVGGESEPWDHVVPVSKRTRAQVRNSNNSRFTTKSDQVRVIRKKSEYKDPSWSRIRIRTSVLKTEFARRMTEIAKRVQKAQLVPKLLKWIRLNEIVPGLEELRNLAKLMYDKGDYDRSNWTKFFRHGVGGLLNIRLLCGWFVTWWPEVLMHLSSELTKNVRELLTVCVKELKRAKLVE